ncbi:MAG: ParB/RepB/Spo0J family partition protein, partial [Planctomycetota bacterium]
MAQTFKQPSNQIFNLSPMPTKTPAKRPIKKQISKSITKSDGPSRLERMRAKLAGGGAAIPVASEQAPTPTTPTTDDQQGRRLVPIEQVIENPGNERKTFRGMEGITATVAAFGILEPPTVEQLDDGRYLLVTGHRRARAARELGHTEIEVLVRDADTDRMRRRKSIVSNVQHQDVDAIELAEGLQALLDEDDEVNSQADLAEAIGKTRSWVSETLGILRLKPALQVKIKQCDRQ